MSMQYDTKLYEFCSELLSFLLKNPTSPDARPTSLPTQPVPWLKTQQSPYYI